MVNSPDPLDSKYAPGAEQARQDVMVGVSTAMTFIGGTFRHLTSASYRLLTDTSLMCRASGVHARLFRPEHGP
jgi:hypothetical protein